MTRLPNLEVTLHAVPGLDYDDSHPRPRLLGEELVRRLRALGFAPDETVVHAHNHSLSLNVSLPGALVWLAEHGYLMPTCITRS